MNFLNKSTKNAFDIRKKITCIIGIALGITIIIIGFCVQNIAVNASSFSVGKYIEFRGDFYTEIYDVTRDVGDAINRAQQNICAAVMKTCDAIGWLIVAIGLFDIAYFVCKIASCEGSKTIDDASDAPQQEIQLPLSESPNSNSVSTTDSVDKIVEHV